MKKEELMKRVKEYVTRTKNDTYAKNYDLEKDGVYEFVSGNKNEWGNRDVVAYYEGRFIDVVATIIQHKRFGGWYCSAKDAGNSHNGYIRLYKPPEVQKVQKIGGLVEYVKKVEQLEAEEAALEKN